MLSFLSPAVCPKVPYWAQYNSFSYSKDITAVFDKRGIKRDQLFAGDKQLLTSVTVTDVSVAKSNTEACVTDVQAWCASHRLQHSPSKTEVIWLGTRCCLQQLAGTDLNLTI